jgi:hypothetical protein
MHTATENGSGERENTDSFGTYLVRTEKKGLSHKVVPIAGALNLRVRRNRSARNFAVSPNSRYLKAPVLRFFLATDAGFDFAREQAPPRV